MLQYVNSCPFPVSVAIMRYTPNCVDGGDWTKEGWWNIPPGESRIPFGGNLGSVYPWWCDYITGNGQVWPGSGIYRYLTLRRFKWCEWTSSSDAFQANMYLFNVDGNADKTWNIVP
ncbi:DUF1036 domain-containing protein [Streptomyces sp. TRM76323]|uniref:DUF1036 domain-containing protein n=1 Tax=Streptomyces tamarix TaxID=3078565 RepID=A0ABU3QH34_9ACTN|nr:DUF1036 domain-containing protein [Streptomyces tamarix]MDT9682082.1 DUF1036 domain-containing protein [Streptomyces tamarix]